MRTQNKNHTRRLCETALIAAIYFYGGFWKRKKLLIDE